MAGAMIIAAPLSVGISAGEPAVSHGSNATAAKQNCHKIKNKKKRKKCLKHQSGPTPSGPTTLTAKCDNCDGVFAPVSKSDGETVTISGHLSPDAGGSPVELWYNTGIASAYFHDEFVNTDPSGNWTKTFTLNEDNGYNDSITVQFHGDAKRGKSLTTLTIFVYSDAPA